MDKIFEVTGITDSSQINKAIKAVQDDKGAYEIGDVIQYLVSDPEPSLKLTDVILYNICISEDCFICKRMLF